MIAIRQWLLDHIADIALIGVVCYFLFHQRQLVVHLHYCPKIETYLPATPYPFHI